MPKPNQYAHEEVASSYTYPPEYKGPRPIIGQVMAIAAIFDLDPSHALEFARNLPALEQFVPADALKWTGWFAIPSVDALAKRFFPEVADPAERYCRAVQLLQRVFGGSGRHCAALEIRNHKFEIRNKLQKPKRFGIWNL